MADKYLLEKQKILQAIGAASNGIS